MGSGLRRVNYFVKHLLADSDGNSATALRRLDIADVVVGASQPSSTEKEDAIDNMPTNSVASSPGTIQRSAQLKVTITDLELQDHPGSNNAYKVRLALTVLGIPFSLKWVDIFANHADIGTIPQVSLKENGVAKVFKSSETFFEWLNTVLRGDSAIKPMDKDDLHRLLFEELDLGRLEEGLTMRLDTLLNRGIQSYRGIVEYRLFDIISWERYAMKNVNKPLYQRALDFFLIALMPLEALKQLPRVLYHLAKEKIAFGKMSSLDATKQALGIVAQHHTFLALLASDDVTVGDIFVFGNLAVLARNHYRKLMLPTSASSIYQPSLHGCTDADALPLSLWMDKMLGWLKGVCPEHRDGSTVCEWRSGVQPNDNILYTADRGTDLRTEAHKPWREVDDTRARHYDLRVMHQGYRETGGI